MENDGSEEVFEEMPFALRLKWQEQATLRRGGMAFQKGGTLIAKALMYKWAMVNRLSFQRTE